MGDYPHHGYMYHPYHEDIVKYREGGYHPVLIGDIINNRYMVVNKLAFASCSTVWLVEDIAARRFVSLKIISAEKSATSSEMIIAQHLQKQQAQLECHPGRQHVVQILDTFMIQGPNGTHHCIVMELLGISIGNQSLERVYGWDCDNFPQEVKKRVAAQVALGVAYLHKCGIIHADLHLGNMLFYSSELQDASLDDLNEIYWEPERVPLLYMDGSPVPPSAHRPEYMVTADHTKRLLELCLLADKIHVKLCDFGEATIYKPHSDVTKPFVFNTPLPFRAPEILFHDISSPTFSSDTWSLGILLYMIMNTRHPPFEQMYAPDGGVVNAMVWFLGILPEKWWTQWEKRSEYYDESGVSLRHKILAGTQKLGYVVVGNGQGNHHIMLIYAPAGPGVEVVHNYKVGGFHPVNIDDVFNDRYRVINKLGYGANGTVWLVEDLSLNRFASLKVISARESSGSSELSVARHLQSQQELNTTHPGRKHVVQILDTFIIHGPNGTHQCIVSEILGTSLSYEVRDYYGEEIEHFPEDVTKKVAAQVALGVSYLHKCRVIHGDLHLGNVLFYSPKLQNASLEELHRIYGPPRLKPIISREDWVTEAPPSPHIPRHLVAVISGNLRLLELSLSSVDDIHVKICDFGEASTIGSSVLVDKPFNTHMPCVFRSPEILFKDILAPTTAMDVWALGVLLYMIINDKCPLFDSENKVDDEVIQDIVVILGKPPDKWWVKVTERFEFLEYGGSYMLESLKNLNPYNRLEGIYGSKCFSDEEHQAFTQLLRKIFRYDPEERIEAEEVVHQLPQGWVDPRALDELSGSSL